MSRKEFPREHGGIDNASRENLARLQQQILQIGKQPYLNILQEGNTRFEAGDYKRVGFIGKSRVSSFKMGKAPNSPECRLEFDEEKPGSNPPIVSRSCDVISRHARPPYDPFARTSIILAEKLQSISRVTLSFTAEKNRRGDAVIPGISYEKIAAFLGNSHMDDFIGVFCASREDYGFITRHRKIKDLAITLGLSEGPNLVAKARFLWPEGRTDDLNFRFDYDPTNNEFGRVVTSQDGYMYRNYWRVSGAGKIPVGLYISLLRETIGAIGGWLS